MLLRMLLEGVQCKEPAIFTLDHQCYVAGALEAVRRETHYDEHVVHKVSEEVQICRHLGWTLGF